MDPGYQRRNSKKLHAFLKLRPVKFLKLEGFPDLWAPSTSTFTNYMFSEVTLDLLQRSSKKLPLDGRYVFENTLINMMTSTLRDIEAI